MKCVLPLPICSILSILLPLALDGETTFEFLRDGELHGVTTSQLPRSMEREGITLMALAAYSPVNFGNEHDEEQEQANAINSSNNHGLGIDSISISNANFSAQFGTDLLAESLDFNYLEAITLSFDHTIRITELGFTDLEQHEKFIVATDTGLEVDILGTVPWSTGNSGLRTFSGAELGDLADVILERGTRITFTFDTVDPDDRIPDGDGNNLAASPSAALRWIKVSPPPSFSLGTPFAVQGGPEQATVGVELWGGSADVTLYWSLDPENGWTHQVNLGTRSPVKIENALLTELAPNTVWYYMFEADNGSEIVRSPIAKLLWATDLYVSPQGNDQNDGLEPTTPLRSIDVALERVRAMARRPQPEGPLVPNFFFDAESPHGQELQDHLEELVDPVTIHLMPGYHYLEETVLIDKSTDGNIHFRGVWAEDAEWLLSERLGLHGNDPDWLDPPATHLPVVSGGKAIESWVPTTVNGVSAWMAELPEVAAGDWHFHQLFVNGRRATQSRWPKQGWFRMEEADHTTRLSFQMSERDERDIPMDNLTNLNDVQTVVLQRWVETRNRIAAYNLQTRWLELLPPAEEPLFNFNASHPIHGAGLAPYYLENVFEMMSEPGEWYLNRITGNLYYIPLPGETMETAHVVAPRLKQLIRVVGKAAGRDLLNERIWNVTFGRIAFMHTQVEDLDMHMGTPNYHLNSGRGSIEFRFARSPQITACLFGHVGEVAIEFAEETAGGTISANLFRSLGFGGLKMWTSNSISDLQQKSGWVTINDNDSLGHGRYWRDGLSILVSECAFMVVEHNYVRNGDYSGIRISGGNSLMRYGFSNIIRKNRVHDIGHGVLSDLAGIYIPGKSPHSVVENNVVHNIHARDYQSQTVYADGENEHWTVRNNWLYGTNERSVTIKGWSQYFYNNVIAFNSGDGLIDRRDSPLLSSASETFPLLARSAPEIKGNIFLLAGSGFVYQKQSYTDSIQPWAELENNLYWNQTGRVWMMADGKTLADFQSAESQDLNSVEEDPLLVDPQRGDFRLSPDSPAIQFFGFNPMDNHDAGIRGSVWQSLGAVTFSLTADQLPEWLPSDVPGLEGWLDAADFNESGPLHQWDNKTPYSFIMRQFDTDLQPVVELDSRNGLPVVRFPEGAWMGTHEYAWRTRRFSGHFRDREFTIFIVHGGASNHAPVLSKGTPAEVGGWTIDSTINWDGTYQVGSPGTSFAVRAWRRNGDAWQGYENGVLVDSSTDDLEQDFDSEGILYLGSDGDAAYLTGEIAEVLVYAGHVSDADVAAINTYLMDKWLGENQQTILFAAENLLESTAAYGRGYLRTLSTHLTDDWDPADITFHKLSGPEWLMISPDGLLSGTPDPDDSGLNTFEVEAVNSTGGWDKVTLQVVVSAPNPSASTPVGAIQLVVEDGSIVMRWEPSPDADFSHYVIRSSPDLSGFSIIAEPVWNSHYSTPVPVEGKQFLVVVPVNTSGN